jgi:hypothetical protein
MLPKYQTRRFDPIQILAGSFISKCTNKIPLRIDTYKGFFLISCARLGFMLKSSVAVNEIIVAK